MEEYICNQLEGIGATDVFVIGDNASFGIQAKFGNKSIQASSYIKSKCFFPMIYIDFGVFTNDLVLLNNYDICFPEVCCYEKSIPIIIEIIPKALDGESHAGWKAVKSEGEYVLKQL